jgi:hypothetical protein
MPSDCGWAGDRELHWDPFFCVSSPTGGWAEERTLPGFLGDSCMRPLTKTKLGSRRSFKFMTSPTFGKHRRQTGSPRTTKRPHSTIGLRGSGIPVSWTRTFLMKSCPMWRRRDLDERPTGHHIGDISSNRFTRN